jgi:hypothetical protein
MKRRRVAAIITGAVLPLIPVAPAHAQNANFEQAITDGTPLADVRLRFESVDQAGFSKNAEATTLRARLGYQTGQFLGFAALAEGDFVEHFGPRHFADTVHPAPGYPAIWDPDMAVLNRLQLSYGAWLTDSAQAPDFLLTAGRQRIVYGNGRFIGNADWRQHEQTYDAVGFVDTSLPATALSYAYAWRVNRIFGPDSPLGEFNGDSHFFDAVYAGLPNVRFNGFAYLLDFREAPAFSSATYGVRGDGTFDLGDGFTARLNAAYAEQDAYARNPAHLGLDYYLGEAGLAYGGLAGLVGYEVLGGNGSAGFQTPLANLHAFQGWAESFLNKPPEGLRDFYVRTTYGSPAAPVFARLSATVIYHDYSAEHVSAGYGNEWDAQLEGQVDPHLVLDVAYADYVGGGPFPDKRAFWLYATYRY